MLDSVQRVMSLKFNKVVKYTLNFILLKNFYIPVTDMREPFCEQLVYMHIIANKVRDLLLTIITYMTLQYSILVNEGKKTHI